MSLVSNQQPTVYEHRVSKNPDPFMMTTVISVILWWYTWYREFCT